MNKRPSGSDRGGVSFIGLVGIKCLLVLNFNCNYNKLKAHKLKST